MREGINSPELAPPAGPFSHVVKAGGLLYLSGQLAQNPQTGLVEGNVVEQTTQILHNLSAALKAVQRDLSHVVKVNVFLTDMNDFAAMNEVYATYFDAPYPARSTIAVKALPLGARVEMECIATAMNAFSPETPDGERKDTMSNTPPKAYPSTLQAIGNTPLVQLRKLVPADSATVFVKLEYFNPTGSYKDRMALAMIEEAEARGDLRRGMTVVEYTGGSTGSSLAFVCAVKGYPFRVVSSDAFAREKLQTMQAFGAELTIVPSQGGQITPDLIPRMMEEARTIASSQKETYWTNQVYNTDSLKGYATIGQEVLQQVDGPIHAFCGGVGTAGMLMGVAGVLRQAQRSVRIIALEPASSAVISTGRAGTHHVEGIGLGFLPPLLRKDLYDEARGIDEAEARQLARQLAKEEGIFGGFSTGLNVLGALQVARELGPGHTVVTVAVDTGLKYLAGDLYAI